MSIIDDTDDLFDHENTLDQYSTYDKIGVKEVTESLTSKAKNLISGFARVYTSVGISVDEEFIDSIKSVETDALISMLKQVKYGEHMLDTLMKRLDNGGYVDKEIYDQIKDMQHHVIQMNLEVTKYTRLLPEFFKFTETDVKEVYHKQEPMQLSSSNNDQQSIDVTIVQDKKQLGGPQFGTKSFLESIDMHITSMDHIDEILENEPEIDLGFDPGDITDNDEKFDDEND